MSFFSRFIKRLQLPRLYREAASEVFGKNIIRINNKIIPDFMPGDMVTFNYKGDTNSRRFLVVATEAAPRGSFLSYKGNRLLCGYDLSKKETLPGLITIFESFYKKRRTNYRSMKKTMSSIFGPNTYKTFNYEHISHVYDIDIKVLPNR